MATGVGRGWAYTGAGLGVALSVAANIGHSYVPPAGAEPGWSPPAGAVLGAAAWPVLLLVALEILARTPWPDLARWTVLRWAGLGVVAVVAAVVSYRHMSGLLTWWGEDAITSRLGPLAVDGLMVMATSALIATSRARAVADEPERPTGTPVREAEVPALARAAVAAGPPPRRPLVAAVPAAAAGGARRRAGAGGRPSRAAAVEWLREHGWPGSWEQAADRSGLGGRETFWASARAEVAGR